MTLQRKSLSVRTYGRRSRAKMFISFNEFQGTSTEPVTYVGGGGGAPPPLHHGKQVGLYVTCQQLPRTGAVTSQGNKRGAPALWQTSPALPSPAPHRPPVDPPFWAPQLNFQLAVKTKTPVTFRSKLHKPLKNSRAVISFKSMIRLLNKHNKAPQILAATPPSQTCLCALKANCEIRTAWTRVIIVVCVEVDPAS